MRLPFSLSNIVATYPFQIIYYDAWTSLIQIISGLKYYVVCLDQYSHFDWVYLLCYKFDVFFLNPSISIHMLKTCLTMTFK